MKISDHFNLGFHDTPPIRIHPSAYPAEPLDIRDEQTARPASKQSRARRSLAVIIPAIVLVLCVALSLAFFSLRRPPAASPSPAIGKPNPLSDPLPAVWAFAALLGLALLLGVLAFVLYLLRRIANPLYWQLACWFLISIGILLRPFVASGADPLQTTIRGALVAGVVALGVFPGLMRLLNRLKPEPGLLHVALPFALGFFLDIAQVVAKTYVPNLTWLQ